MPIMPILPIFPKLLLGGIEKLLAGNPCLNGCDPCIWDWIFDPELSITFPTLESLPRQGVNEH